MCRSCTDPTTDAVNCPWTSRVVLRVVLHILSTSLHRGLFLAVLAPVPLACFACLHNCTELRGNGGQERSGKFWQGRELGFCNLTKSHFHHFLQPRVSTFLVFFSQKWSCIFFFFFFLPLLCLRKCGSGLQITTCLFFLQWYLSDALLRRVEQGCISDQ